jgi:hypothetical protein
MLPLTLAGAQIGWRRPAVLPDGARGGGGLAFSTVVSLLFLPTIYTLLDDANLSLRRIIAARASARRESRSSVPTASPCPRSKPCRSR